MASKKKPSEGKEESAEAPQELEEGTVLVEVVNIQAGQEVKANDGTFYSVKLVDLVLDPRKEVYDNNTKEAIVFMSSPSGSTFAELMSGSAVVRAS